MSQKLENSDLLIHACNRCGCVWTSRREPKTCSKCRSPYWNKERLRKIKNKD